MNIKGVIYEDFTNYKYPCMFISSVSCDWKCCKEHNFPISICQNCEMVKNKNIQVEDEKLIKKYLDNPISKSIVFGGLEWMLQFDELYNFVKKFRSKSNDDIVIYTGYCPEEIFDKIVKLSKYKNIIIKFGRFIPNSSKHHDEVLGVNLASDNQYAIKVS